MTRASSITARRGQGFTLVELLVSILLTVVIIGTTAQIFQTVHLITSQSADQINAARETHAALEILERDLKHMERVADPEFTLTLSRGTLELDGGLSIQSDALTFLTRQPPASELIFVEYRLEPTALDPRLVRIATAASTEGGALVLSQERSVEPLLQRAAGLVVRIFERSVAGVLEPRRPAGTREETVITNVPDQGELQAGQLMTGVERPPPPIGSAAAGALSVAGGTRRILILERQAPPEDDRLRLAGSPSNFEGPANLVGFGEPPALEVTVKAFVGRVGEQTLSSLRLLSLK